MSDTARIIKNYLRYFPQDKPDLDLLLRQIDEEKNIFDRKNFIGHVVANALIINDKKVLTIFHNFLNMHLQPGGHVDKVDSSAVKAAEREAREETGISDLEVSPWHMETGIPIFIESHIIPKNPKKNEEEHYHHDFMYIFKTDTEKIELQLNEVSDFRWVDFDRVLEEESDSFLSKSLKRALEQDII